MDSEQADGGLVDETAIRGQKLPQRKTRRRGHTPAPANQGVSTAQPLSPRATRAKRRADREHGPAEIGEGSGWDDFVYNLIRKSFFGERLRSLIPKPVRRLASRILHVLFVLRHLDRLRNATDEDPRFRVELPAGEQVSFSTFWMVEYFSPSHADTLEKRLSKTKWRGDVTRSGEVPHKSFRRGRDTHGLVGSENVARFVTNRIGRSFGETEIGLPPSIDRVQVTMETLGPALTAIVARFDLSAAGRKALNDALCEPHQPHLYFYKGSLQVKERMFVGLEKVQRERERIHNDARRWMKRELPGSFAETRRLQHPALDLITTKKFDPLASDREVNDMNFHRAMGFDRDLFDRTRMPDFSATFSDYRREDDSRSRFDEGWQIIRRAQEEISRESERHLVQNLQYSAPALLTRAGIFSLLSLKQAQAAQARDAAHRLYSKNPVASAKSLRKAALKSSLDLMTIAEDVKTLSSDPRSYNWSLPSLMFEKLDEDGKPSGEPDPNITKIWAKRQKKWAAQLHRLDNDLSRILSLSSSLTASIDSSRSQRWSLLVAVASLIASGLAGYLAFLALDSA